MCFNAILENYRLSKSFEKRDYVSEHWNVFNTNFDKVITNKRIWERMLRNALTLGLNDNLANVSNERFAKDDEKLWQRLKSGEYDDLIFDIQDEDKTSIKFHEKNLIATIAFTDLKFVMQNTLTNVGSPVAAKFKTNGKFGVSEILCNLHDLDDITRWRFNSLACFFLKSHFCGGAGYGGLQTKIRNNIPKICIIDLPELTPFRLII